MFMSIRKSPLIVGILVTTLALTIDAASAQHGGGSSRGSGAGVRAGFTGSAAVRAAPRLGTQMRLPQQATMATGAAVLKGSSSSVASAPTSPDPPASGQLSRQGATILSQPASPPSAPPTLGATPTPPPTPAIAAPTGQLLRLAPLSSPAATTFFTGSGGSTAAASPFFSSSAPTSPSQAAPSAPGGGGNTLEDCIGFWDRETHMTKSEWRTSCQRTQHRLDDVAREFAQKPVPARPKH